jgi:signal transduction histidine kinase
MIKEPPENLSAVLKDHDLLRYFVKGVGATFGVPLTFLEKGPEGYRTEFCRYDHPCFTPGCKKLIESVDPKPELTSAGIKGCSDLGEEVSLNEVSSLGKITPCSLNDVLLLVKKSEEIIKHPDGKEFRCHMGIPVHVFPIMARGKAWGYFFVYKSWEVDIETVESRLNGFQEYYPDFEIDPESLDEIISSFASQKVSLDDRWQEVMESISWLQEYSQKQLRKTLQDSFLFKVGNKIQLLKAADLSSLSKQANEILEEVRKFLRTEYILFFCGRRPEESVIDLHGWASKKSFPDEPPQLHFNWKKGKLPMEPFEQREFDPFSNLDQTRVGFKNLKGITLAPPSTILPVYWEASNRCALICGPFQRLDTTNPEDQTLLLRVANSLATRLQYKFQHNFSREAEKDNQQAVRLLRHRGRAGAATVSSEAELIMKLLERRNQALQEKERILEGLERIIFEVDLSLAGKKADIFEQALPELEPRRFNWEAIDLLVLVENLGDRLSAQLSDGVTFNIDEKSFAQRPRVNSVRVMVDTVLTYLVTNAMKFAKPGSEIKLTAESDLESVIIKVIDEGIGIHEDDRENIFKRGERGRWLGGPKSKARQGEGLGLFHARQIMNKLDGKINVESDFLYIGKFPGEWYRVTFSVHLPLESNR